MLGNTTKQPINYLKELQTLCADLSNLGAVPKNDDVFKYSINFFNLVVSFQDKINKSDFFKEQMFKTAKAQIIDLMDLVSNSGRNKSGTVRANVGEPVTMDNVFLGNPEEFWKLPLSDWMKADKRFKDNIRERLRLFVAYHTETMQIQIKRIIKNAEMFNAANMIQRNMANNNNQRVYN